MTIAREILRLKTRTHVTSVVVTHERELAFGVADRIALMVEGQILAIGTAAEIKGNSDPMVQRFLNVNFNQS